MGKKLQNDDLKSIKVINLDITKMIVALKRLSVGDFDIKPVVHRMS